MPGSRVRVPPFPPNTFSHLPLTRPTAAPCPRATRGSLQCGSPPPAGSRFPPRRSAWSSARCCGPRRSCRILEPHADSPQSPERVTQVVHPYTPEGSRHGSFLLLLVPSCRAPSRCSPARVRQAPEPLPVSLPIDPSEHVRRVLAAHQHAPLDLGSIELWDPLRRLGSAQSGVVSTLANDAHDVGRRH
jgi:hypothetical protein